MIYTKIYVGSNNVTNVLEIEKIHDILDGLQGYTMTIAKGYWQGKLEDTAIIEIYGDYNLGIISDLKRILQQGSIMVVTSIVDVTF